MRSKEVEDGGRWGLSHHQKKKVKKTKGGWYHHSHQLKSALDTVGSIYHRCATGAGGRDVAAGRDGV